VSREIEPGGTSFGPGLRVSYDARLIGFAGIGRMIEALWRALVELGVDVVGLWPAGAPRDWMGSQRPDPAGPHVSIRARPFLPAEQFAMPRVLGQLGATVHHAPAWSVPYLTGRPIVLTVHDLYPYLDPTVPRSRTRAAVYRIVVPLAIRKAALVVAVSPLAAQQVAETFHLSEDRLRIVEHGIDHDRWRRPQDAEIERVLARHRLPTDYLLYVGSLQQHKNLSTLFAAHRPDHPPLVLAGPSSEELARSELATAIRSEVIAVGRVQSELPALYAGALALLLPSLFESVGFTALEAMACGTPVVASNGGGLPHTVGDGGLLVAPLDVAAWSDALSRVSEDETLRRALAEAGVRLAGKRSWRHAAEQYLAIYEEAAA
jgi:glycosyltransferase involved in cell wall biosynthesis